MSHQSGITASRELQAFLAGAKRPGSTAVRIMQIGIQNETLVLKQHIDTPPATPRRGSGRHHHLHEAWQEEYDELLLPLLDPQQPSYFLFRTDQQDADGSFRWLFILWSPDSASIRDKMLYASTKATLKREFGEGHILYELFGTQRNDVNMKAYKHARRMSAGDDDDSKDKPSLTLAEHELRAMRLDEAERIAVAGGAHHQHKSHIHNEVHVSRVHVSKSSSAQHASSDAGGGQHVTSVVHNVFGGGGSGAATAAAVSLPSRISVSANNADVAFPISDDAVRAIHQFVQRHTNYVQLSLDLLKEKVLLESSSAGESNTTTLIQSIRERIPRDRARYHLYRFVHVHADDGQRYEPVFFIFTVPSDFTLCPAKERMIYSSCKGPLLEQLHYAHHVHVDKKLEISSDDLHSELSDAALRHAIHSSGNAARATHAVDEKSGRAKAQFDKPQGPPGSRGPRRLVR